MNFDLKTKEGLNNTIAILLRRRIVPPIFTEEERYAPDGYNYFGSYNDGVDIFDLYIYAGTKDTEKYFFTNRLDPKITRNAKKISQQNIFNNSITEIKKLELIFVAYKKRRSDITYDNAYIQNVINNNLIPFLDSVYDILLPSDWWNPNEWDYLSELYYTSQSSTRVHIYMSYNGDDACWTNFISNYFNITYARRITSSNIDIYWWQFDEIFSRDFDIRGTDYTGVGNTFISIYDIWSSYDPEELKKLKLLKNKDIIS